MGGNYPRGLWASPLPLRARIQFMLPGRGGRAEGRANMTKTHFELKLPSSRLRLPAAEKPWKKLALALRRRALNLGTQGSEDLLEARMVSFIIQLEGNGRKWKDFAQSGSLYRPSGESVFSLCHFLRLGACGKRSPTWSPQETLPCKHAHPRVFCFVVFSFAHCEETPPSQRPPSC